MQETIVLGDVVIAVTRKNVKHVHLSVHPPEGAVTLVAPTATRLDVARAYAISRLPWIRDQKARFRSQARELPRRLVTRESHYVWGRRFLLSVVEQDDRPGVRMDHRRIVLTVPPGSDTAKREAVMQAWYRGLLHAELPKLIRKWEPLLGVKVSRYYVQRMKTRWGGCNPRAGNIRINTELAKKPKDLLEYVVVHEMTHLLEPTHGERFVTILDRHWKHWREARAELNELPLAALG